MRTLIQPTRHCLRPHYQPRESDAAHIGYETIQFKTNEVLQKETTVWPFSTKDRF